MVDKTPAELSIAIIPIDQIRVINPRVRDKAKFARIVRSMPDIGLKRPIIVSRRKAGETAEPGYDLVCGQGRLEAFVELGEKEIPAIVIEVSKKQRLQMSLVENLARRHNSYLELTRSLQLLKERGCSNTQIAHKTGLSVSYVGNILRLLEAGEERLVEAVAGGHIPLNAALEIMKLDDSQLQSWLTEAYESGDLKGKDLRMTRRLAEKRRLLGKGQHQHPHGSGGGGGKAALIREYQKQAEIQKLQVKKAELVDTRRSIIEASFRQLLGDENFINLLRAEGLHDLPRLLSDGALKGGGR